MYKLTAMYPNGDGVRFDFAYYTGTHDRLVKDLLGRHGLTRIEGGDGERRLDGARLTGVAE